MKGTRRVSALMLERYRLGEVSVHEREMVEAELSLDRELRLRYEALDDSDRELRRSYPWEQSSLKSLPGLAGFRGETVALAGPGGGCGSTAGVVHERGRFRMRGRLWGLCAAALLLCVLFPSLYFLRSPGRDAGLSHGIGDGISAAGPDRIKGTGLRTELSIYLKESPASAARETDEGRKLPDRTLLSEGNTVQLAYTTPPGAVYYGVIFSIDGRSTVTLHYPYRKQQNPVLTAGKRTFLGEAYTLDDAPDFELFFMVISPDPLDTENVLKIAGELAGDPITALEKSAAAFSGCDVETITIRKQE